MNRIWMILLAGVFWLATPVSSKSDTAEVEVRVTGLRSQKGSIGCALFSKSTGFPMSPAQASNVRKQARGTSVTCSWSGLVPGDYAVSVTHDENNNRKVDVNFLGIPLEGWAVSNNVVPGMRAPTYAEARFSLGAGQKSRHTLKLVY